MAVAFVFPGPGQPGGRHGQGAGRGLSRRRAAVFEEVDAALGEKLSAIIWEGPGRDADAHRKCAAGADGGVARRDARARGRGRRRSRARRGNSSPAIRSANIRRSPRPARSRIADAARLLRIRGRAMQKAVPVGVGAMAALLGLEFDAAKAVAAEAAQGEVCQAANDNGGGQVVVSGDKAAVERAVEIAKAKGAKRAMMLPVSAPFHCALMQPAADAMAEALAAGHGEAAGGAGGRQCAGAADQRSGRDRAQPGRSRSPARCAGASRLPSWRERA